MLLKSDANIYPIEIKESNNEEKDEDQLDIGYSSGEEISEEEDPKFRNLKQDSFLKLNNGKVSQKIPEAG